MSNELRRILEEPSIQVPIIRNWGNGWEYMPFHNLECRDTPLKDVSRQAVWTLSSCRSGGFGIYELLDDDPRKMWQSDGLLPHTVTIEFQKKTEVCFLCIYMDFKNDETIKISKGSSVFFLKDEVYHHYQEPNGWRYFDLRTQNHLGEMIPSRIFVIQALVIGNHQNGRDSHIRHMRVIGPKEPRIKSQWLTDAELEVNVPEDTDDLNHQALYRDYVIR